MQHTRKVVVDIFVGHDCIYTRIHIVNYPYTHVIEMNKRRVRISDIRAFLYTAVVVCR